MARTDSTNVEGVLGDNYDGTTTLTPYIDTASAVVDQLVAAISDAGLSALSSTVLELIERWLSAHYYTVMDPLYTSKSTGAASGSWKERDYLTPAKHLDSSGLLAGILEGQKTAQIFWGGKRESQQIDWVDRR